MKDQKLLFSLFLIVGILAVFISCSRENTTEVPKVYTATISMKTDGIYSSGNISYKDENGKKVVVEDVDFRNQTYSKSFTVNKGYETDININLLGLTGTLNFAWTIKDQFGNTYQNFTKNVYREQKSYSDSYKEKL